MTVRLGPLNSGKNTLRVNGYAGVVTNKMEQL